MSFIRPTPPVTDPKICADIRRELREGTPDTPARVAAIRRADEAYERSFARPQFRTKLKDWVASASHDAVKRARADTMKEFRLAYDWAFTNIHPGILLYFIERLAELTL